jgi:two-component system chemotaxis response regulator CheY
MRALIVDDSPAARELGVHALEQVLEELGVDIPVETAENGTAALRELAQGDAWILLLDLHMPDLHGLEVLRFWKQKRPEGSRALIVSTQVSEHDRKTALDGGAYGFLEKPLTPATLRAALEGQGAPEGGA